MNRIRISEMHYDQLREHLFPGDGKEAVAIALCGRSNNGENTTLLVQDVLLIPYESCYERKPDFVYWPTNLIDDFVERAAKNNLGILKIHCHPGGFDKFSQIDTDSDIKLFTSIHAWVDGELPHASCIMLPDGRIFGRFFTVNMHEEIVHQISVAGSDIHNWYYGENNTMNEELHIRNMQVFGKKTIAILNKMRVGVVGFEGSVIVYSSVLLP